jgi:CheY-like chemotaxis protein
LDHAPVDVLVIDDHEVNQEVMAQMLRRLGCQVRCAGSAEAGLLALCDGPSDLVLMDLEMPGMHGMEALAWLRRGACDRFALQVPASTPVVAVTAHALAGDGERCLAQGFDAYLAKPCRLEDLRDVVQGLLGRLPLPAIDEAGIVPGRAEVQRFDAYQSVVPVDGSSEAACLASRLPSQASERASDTTSIKEMAINEKNGDGMPVFDPQALVRLRALDPKGQNQLLVRVMKAFEVSLQRMSVQLASAWQQRDLTGIRQVAHTLKSSSASVGALRVSGLCLEVETSLRGVQADAPGSLIDGAREPVDQLLAEIERVRQALPGWLIDAQSSSRSGD